MQLSEQALSRVHLLSDEEVADILRFAADLERVLGTDDEAQAATERAVEAMVVSKTLDR